VARSRRLPLIGFVAAALVTAGCFLPVVVPPITGSGTPTPQPSGTPQPGAATAWRDCRDVPTQLVGRAAPGMTYECTTIKVPKDWAKPGGVTLDLALLRIRSRGQHDRIGSLVLNPGGPGASGIDTAVYLSFGPGFGGLPHEVTDRFDIVGFDPRGVGRSSPVRCIPDDVLDKVFGYEPDPRTQAEFDGFVTLTRSVAEGCAAKYGDDLRLYSTEQAAHDMDAIRTAVGDAKTTYLGFSYGTLLGATYAQLFPDKVRALVLDGAVDPKASAVAASEGQAKGFEQAFNNFAAWCRTAGSDCPIAPDARAAVNDVMAKARAAPVRGGDGREATAGWVFNAIVSALYTESAWKDLASAIHDLGNGQPDGVFHLADQYAQRDDQGHYSNLFDAFYTVGCADDPSTISPERIRALQSDWRRKYPLFGPNLAVTLLQCAEWKTPRDPYPTGAAKGAPPIVVVGTTGDPATPYAQTAKLATMLGVGHVLTWEGEGHTAYPNTKCITDAVDAYLIDLRVPPEGQRCPAR
jgi:pimeloyl-ACP methyl ester carboxylesterase